MSITIDTNVYQQSFISTVEIKTPPLEAPVTERCKHSLLADLAEFHVDSHKTSQFPEFKQVSIIDPTGHLSSVVARGCAYKHMPIDVHIWNSKGRCFRADKDTVSDHVPVTPGTHDDVSRILGMVTGVPHYVVIPFTSEREFPSTMYGASEDQLFAWFDGILQGDHSYYLLITDDFWERVFSCVASSSFSHDATRKERLYRKLVAHMDQRDDVTVAYLTTPALSRTPNDVARIISNFVCGPPAKTPVAKEYALSLSFAEGRAVCAEIISDMVMSPSALHSNVMNPRESVRVGTDAVHVCAMAAQTLKFNVCGIVVGDEWSRTITSTNDFTVQTNFKDEGFDAMLMDGLSIVNMFRTADEKMPVTDPRMVRVWTFRGRSTFGTFDRYQGLVNMLNATISKHLADMYQRQSVAPSRMSRRQQSAHPLSIDTTFGLH